MPVGTPVFAPSGKAPWPAGGGGGLSEFVMDAPLPLGWSNTAQVVTPVPFAARAFVTNFEILASSTSWTLIVFGDAAATKVWLKAVNNNGGYSLTWPWIFKNIDDPVADMLYVAIANHAGGAPTFTLQALEAEVVG